MNLTQKNELENFKAQIKQYIGEFDTVEQMLQRIIENGINLVLVNCEGEAIYLQEPDARDCLVES